MTEIHNWKTSLTIDQRRALLVDALRAHGEKQLRGAVTDHDGHICVEAVMCGIFASEERGEFKNRMFYLDDVPYSVAPEEVFWWFFIEPHERMHVRNDRGVPFSQFANELEYRWNLEAAVKTLPPRSLRPTTVEIREPMCSPVIGVDLDN